MARSFPTAAPVRQSRLYEQIAARVAAFILDQDIPVGGRLPAESEIARSLGVSRPAVREAIDFIEAGGDRVDLVLTDLMMPVMDGAATTAYLEDHHPEIPIIAASGLASNGDPGRSIGLGVARFLPKPYTTSLLLTTVHDTLHERSMRETESE